MKKTLGNLKNFVTLKTIAALMLIVSAVFFFLPMFVGPSMIGVKFVPQTYSACTYMIGNPQPLDPAWEHLWIAPALILPLIAVILLFGEQSTGKSIVISVLLVGTIVTWIMMLVNASADFHNLIDLAVAKDLSSIQAQTIVKDTDDCLITIGSSNIFGLFGNTGATAEAVIAKAGVPAGTIVTAGALFFVNLVLLVASLAVSILHAVGVIDANRVLVK